MPGGVGGSGGSGPSSAGGKAQEGASTAGAAHGASARPEKSGGRAGEAAPGGTARTREGDNLAQAVEDPSAYAHSPIHAAIFRRDHAALRALLAALPAVPKASSICTEVQARDAELQAAKASEELDRRDNAQKETPLSLAVRLQDRDAVALLCKAGANISLQNSSGWAPLHDAVGLHRKDLVALLLRTSQVQGWERYQRRLPAITGIMGRMRDFYMELHWAFESPVLPFISSIAPSDTYRIWKRGTNLRTDLTLAGFDGFRLKRRHQSIVFLGEGGEAQGQHFPRGTLLVMHHEKKEVFNALEGAGVPPTDAELAADVADLMAGGVYKAGLDVVNASVHPLSNWWGLPRTETVSGYPATLYEMHDVTFRLRSRKAGGAQGNPRDRRAAPRNGAMQKENEPSSGTGKSPGGVRGAGGGGTTAEGGGSGQAGGALERGSEESLQGLLTEEQQAELDRALLGSVEEDDEGEEEGGRDSSEEQGSTSSSWSFWSSWSDSKRKGSEEKDSDQEEKGSKLGAKNISHGDSLERDEKGSCDAEAKARSAPSGGSSTARGTGGAQEQAATGETELGSNQPTGGAGEAGAAKPLHSETRRALKPLLWLTEEFPLDLNELVPLLDLLAHRVKAVQRLKEVLTLKLPQGRVPVKVAVPVVPAISVQATFSNFREYGGPSSDALGHTDRARLAAILRASGPAPPGTSSTSDAATNHSKGQRAASQPSIGPSSRTSAGAAGAPQSATDAGSVRQSAGRARDQEDAGFHTSPDSPRAMSPKAQDTPTAAMRASGQQAAAGSSWFGWIREARPHSAKSKDASGNAAAESGSSDPAIGGREAQKSQQGAEGAREQAPTLRQLGRLKSRVQEGKDVWTDDPFVIPSSYTWITLAERRRREKEKAKRRTEQK